jgi:UDP-N-acetylglucosamine 1-carboxyvinyltransferase
MVAAAATKGDVLIKNVIPKHLESISAKLIECGANVEEYDDSIRVSMDRRPGKCNIKTMPHPGFPTDMQPQFSVLLSIARGVSIVTESVWDNRFRYAEQLSRMGAVIRVNGKTAVIEGVEGLKGAPIRADDLRAGAAMMIAGLVANGVTEIEEIYHIERGYEDVVEKFRSIGAKIERREYPDGDDKIQLNVG